jgi:hypothetical protein
LDYFALQEPVPFEGVYSQFMKRLEDLDEEDLMEMTASGVLTGLKSWLNFGSNIGPNMNIAAVKNNHRNLNFYVHT